MAQDREDHFRMTAIKKEIQNHLTWKPRKPSNETPMSLPSYLVSIFTPGVGASSAFNTMT